MRHALHLCILCVAWGCQTQDAPAPAPRDGGAVDLGSTLDASADAASPSDLGLEDITSPSDLGLEDVTPREQIDLGDLPIDAAPPEPALTPLEGPLRLRFPIHDEDRHLINTTVILGVDHDPSDGQRVRCQSYEGHSFPFCYDDHDGTDYLLNGGFARMDAGSARIVAAAPGEVIDVEDGHYDRCHADTTTADVSCDGHEMRANFVKLRHPDGDQTWYYHLRAGSVAVEVGEEVPCGAVLGLVGSSGYSSGPHLHFEVKGVDGASMDPYAGEFSQPESRWLEQDAGDELPGARCDPRGV